MDSITKQAFSLQQALIFCLLALFQLVINLAIYLFASLSVFYNSFSEFSRTASVRPTSLSSRTFPWIFLSDPFKAEACFVFFFGEIETDLDLSTEPTPLAKTVLIPPYLNYPPN